MSPPPLGDGGLIPTPDQRVRVFVSSTMEELAAERAAVRRAIEDLHLSPVLFELGARAHPPRSLYSSYLDQSHVFLAIYWQRYGWVAPGMEISGLEDEYLLAGSRPKLIYVKRPADEREPRLTELLDRVRASDDVSYKSFTSAEELGRLVSDDLAVLLSEAFLVPPGHASAGRPPLALPADTTTFVGRAGELEELRALLDRDDVRLVTLTGPGGIGKTRLALRAAAEVAAGFDEGVAFAALASLRDPDLVPAEIAAAVGLRDFGVEPVRDALRHDLAGRSLLLVVDNFEQVLEAAPLLSELLAAAPRINMLVTSRVALRVQAEHEFPVRPLDAPDSVQLFAHRAAAVRHDFEFDGSNAETIAAICRRLEHVPLAIELAAAKVRLLPPDALLTRLENRLDFLVAGARDLPERQRALRRTIEWSYDLLGGDERRLLASLGAFVGGFSLAAVEAVHPDGGDSAAVLDVLASLVDQSLVRAEAAAGEPRFAMLEMIGEFAREKLDESGVGDRVRERHADFYRALAVEIGRRVRGRRQLQWLRNLDADADNIRAALLWMAEHGRLDDFAETAWALWMPAWMNGRLDEGHRTGQVGLHAEGEMSERSRARLLVGSGLFHVWRGEHIEAWDTLGRGLSLARAVDDDEIVAFATIGASMVAGPIEGEARAEELALEGIELCRRLGDRWGEGAGLNVLTWLHVAQGRFDGTESEFETTVAIARDSGDGHLLAMAEVNLAESEMHRGRLAAAEALLADSVERYRALRSLYSTAYMLDAAARLAMHRREQARAALLLGAADQLRETLGVPVWGSQQARRQELVDAVRSSLGHEAYESATAEGRALGYDDALDAAAVPATEAVGGAAQDGD